MLKSGEERRLAFEHRVTLSVSETTSRRSQKHLFDDAATSLASVKSQVCGAESSLPKLPVDLVAVSCLGRPEAGTRLEVALTD
jgi:hypothetical protein